MTLPFSTHLPGVVLKLVLFIDLPIIKILIDSTVASTKADGRKKQVMSKIETKDWFTTFIVFCISGRMLKLLGLLTFYQCSCTYYRNTTKK